MNNPDVSENNKPDQDEGLKALNKKIQEDLARIFESVGQQPQPSIQDGQKNE